MPKPGRCRRGRRTPSGVTEPRPMMGPEAIAPTRRVFMNSPDASRGRGMTSWKRVRPTPMTAATNHAFSTCTARRGDEPAQQCSPGGVGLRDQEGSWRDPYIRSAFRCRAQTPFVTGVCGICQRSRNHGSQDPDRRTTTSCTRPVPRWSSTGCVPAAVGRGRRDRACARAQPSGSAPSPRGPRQSSASSRVEGTSTASTASICG